MNSSILLLFHFALLPDLLLDFLLDLLVAHHRGLDELVELDDLLHGGEDVCGGELLPPLGPPYYFVGPVPQPAQVLL